jgi:hypothetical protein
MEDDMEDDNNPFAVPGVGTPADRVRYTGHLTQLFDAQKANAAKQAEQFNAARESIRQRRYGAPTTSEQLYALSAALLSPRSQPGFAGTMSNLMPALMQTSQLRRSAEDQRAEDLMKLEQQQGLAASTAEMQALENQLKYGKPLLSERAPQTTYDPFTQSVVDKSAGTATRVREVAPPPAPAQLNAGLARLRAYLTSPSATEEGKGQAVMNFATSANMDPREVLRLLGVK